MSASAMLACLITQGREEEARGVLRDYASHLESFGGEVTAYRVIYGGELQGRVLVSWNARTTKERAEMLEKARSQGTADNPYIKAMNSIDPCLATYSRIMYRSIEPDVPPLPQAALRVARVFAAGPGHRAEAEEALRIARRRVAELGYSGEGLILENAGANTDYYVGATLFNSWIDLEDFDQKNAASPPSPAGLIELFAKGTLTSVSRRIDYAFDLGR